MDELRAEGDALALHLEREYIATAAEVWDAWTDPVRLARWLATPSAPVLAGSVGDRVRLTFGDGADDWADVTVRQADPPRLLELQWGFVGEEASVLRVEIVELDGDRVRVVLDHRGLGDSTVGYGAGWEAYLVQLASELGAPVASSWDELFTAALPAWRERAAR